LRESGIKEGLCLVNAMHITASVFINDDESGLHEDYKRWLEQLAPFDPSPERYHTIAPAKTTPTPTTNARSWAGKSSWQLQRYARLRTLEQIFYGEFDGKRPKRVLVKIIGE